MSTTRGTSEHVVDAVAQLVRERDEAIARLAKAEDHEAEVARRMYRRGYLAGRAAERRGSPAVTNPERRARTEMRELMNR